MLPASRFKQSNAECVLEKDDQEGLLCGDGFMDFIHRPKCKILKILQN
jgi:hypothetical protein